MEEKITKIFNAADQIQAEMIHDHLKQNGIETMSKQSGTGEYMSIAMGYSVYGTDIYVREDQKAKAESLINELLEGVAFGLRDSLEVARSLGIKIERTKICGGGAKSPLWKKIIANVMNLKVDVIESEEGPGYGGADYKNIQRSRPDSG